MYAEIVAAIQGTKTAIDLVKATNGLSNYSELLGAVTAVQMKLTDAVSAALASQEKQAALAERVPCPSKIIRGEIAALQCKTRMVLSSTSTLIGSPVPISSSTSDPEPS